MGLAWLDTVIPQGISFLHGSSGSRTAQHGGRCGWMDGWLELGAAVSKLKRAVQSRQIGCGEASRDPLCCFQRKDAQLGLRLLLGDEGVVLVLWGLGVCFEGWQYFSYITSLGKTTFLQVGLRTEGLVWDLILEERCCWEHSGWSEGRADGSIPQSR